jgi:transcriptional regulator with XRE-family HTH domain
MPEVDYEGLAERLRARREALGLTHARIERLGGPSAQTVRKMEQAEHRRRRLDTTHPLEQIYGWAPRSIDGYLDHGTEPEVIREPDYSDTTRALTLDDLADVPSTLLQQALRARQSDSR